MIRILCALAIAAVSMAVVLLLAQVPPSAEGLAPYRWSLALIAAAAMLLWSRDDRRWLLLIPLTLHGLMALFAFSAGGAFFALVIDFEPNELLRMVGREFNGSAADRLLLMFAGGVLCSSALWSMVSAPSMRVTPILSVRQQLFLVVVVLASASLSALLSKLTMQHSIAPLVSGGLVRQATDSLGPLFAISSALLFIDAMSRSGRRLCLVAALLAVAIVIQVLGAVGKVPLFLAAGLALAWLVFAPASGYAKSMAIVGAICVGIVSLTALSYVRGIEGYPLSDEGSGAAPVWKSLAHAAMQKVIERQAHTGYCLDSVIKRHWNSPPAQSPLYFITAPVPRFLWPDKPSLSPGEQYSMDYCGLPDMRSSSSVTLLGQPIIEAGPVGLAVGLGVLMLGLPLLTRVCLNRGTLGIAMLIGLYPWLIDFDQHYALYWANALKVFLYMSPVWGGYLINRRLRGAGPEKGWA